MVNKANYEKWKRINPILTDNLLLIKHGVGDWLKYYYYEPNECWFVYDISDDVIKIIGNKNEIITVLSGDNLNEFTVSQAIIEHTGK